MAMMQRLAKMVGQEKKGPTTKDKKTVKRSERQEDE